MATPLEMLFAAALSVTGGLLGAGVLERLKAGVASVDAELIRLETFEDDLFDALEHPAADKDRPPLLRKLARSRRRLGQNIRRKVTEPIAYRACSGELVRLDRYLRLAEDCAPVTDELEAEIHQTVIRLRSHLRRSSRAARVFAFLRGDA